MLFADAITRWLQSHDSSLSSDTHADVVAIRESVVSGPFANRPVELIDDEALTVIANAVGSQSRLSDNAIGQFLDIVHSWSLSQGAVEEAPPEPASPAADTSRPAPDPLFEDLSAPAASGFVEPVTEPADDDHDDPTDLLFDGPLTSTSEKASAVDAESPGAVPPVETAPEAELLQTDEAVPASEPSVTARVSEPIEPVSAFEPAPIEPASAFEPVETTPEPTPIEPEAEFEPFETTPEPTPIEPEAEFEPAETTPEPTPIEPEAEFEPAETTPEPTPIAEPSHDEPADTLTPPPPPPLDDPEPAKQFERAELVIEGAPSDTTSLFTDDQSLADDTAPSDAANLFVGLSDEALLGDESAPHGDPAASSFLATLDSTVIENVDDAASPDATDELETVIDEPDDDTDHDDDNTGEDETDTDATEGVFSEAASHTNRRSIDWITVAYFTVAAVCFGIVIYLWWSSR